MRTRNGILNFITGYIFYFIIAVLGFVKVKVFISSLGQSLFALNQLYINVFSYLSIAEAGVGIAFTYRLYKLLAENDYESINSIFSGTKEIFKKIGIIICLIGFALSFFIPIFIKDNVFSNLYIYSTFILFVIKNVIDYFMFVPRLVIQADQKLFKINLGVFGYRILEVIIEIILLLNGVNYLIILIPSIFIRIFQNYRTNKKIYNHYPWLKIVENKDYSSKEDIKHMIVHRFVELVNNNTDIIILSTFVGSKAVAIYSSYNYLLKFASDTTSQIFNSLKDGLGNVIQTEEKAKIKDVINEFFVLFSFLATIIIVSFYFILNDFINMWVGKEYVIGKTTLLLFLIILYYSISIRSITIIRTTLGLFKETKIMVGIEALLNIILSIILVNIIGFDGVLIGTIVAFVLTNAWYLPYVVYKKLFDKEGLKLYMVKIIVNIVLTFIFIYLFQFIYPFIPKIYFKIKFLDWMIASVIFGLLIMMVVTIIYSFIYKEFRNIILRIQKIIKKSTVKFSKTIRER